MYQEESIMDNYRVIKEAGKGTYGVVHMAEQKETGRIVAIKKISSNPIEGINFTAGEYYFIFNFGKYYNFYYCLYDPYEINR